MVFVSRFLISICFSLLFISSVIFGEDTKNAILVKDLRRGEFIKLQRPYDIIFYGVFLAASPNNKNLYNSSTGQTLENPNWDRDSEGKKLPENELWYVVTILRDHDAMHNRRTFEMHKKTGEFKYIRLVLQAKDIVERYKPSSVFKAYAEKELKNSDTLVEDWFAHPEKYVKPSQTK